MTEHGEHTATHFYSVDVDLQNGGPTRSGHQADWARDTGDYTASSTSQYGQATGFGVMPATATTTNSRQWSDQSSVSQTIGTDDKWALSTKTTEDTYATQSAYDAQLHGTYALREQDDLGGPWVTLTGTLNDYGHTVTAQSYTDNSTQGPTGGAAHRGGGQAIVEVDTRFDYHGDGTDSEGNAGPGGSWTFGATAGQKGQKQADVDFVTSWSLSPAGDWSQGGVLVKQDGWAKQEGTLDASYAQGDAGGPGPGWTHHSTETTAYDYGLGMPTVTGPGGYPVVGPGGAGGAGDATGKGEDDVTLTGGVDATEVTDQSYDYKGRWTTTAPAGAAGGTADLAQLDVITVHTSGTGQEPHTGTVTVNWGAGFTGVHGYDSQHGDSFQGPMQVDFGYPQINASPIQGTGTPASPRAYDPAPPTGTTATPPAKTSPTVPAGLSSGTAPVQSTAPVSPAPVPTAGPAVHWTSVGTQSFMLKNHQQLRAEGASNFDAYYGMEAQGHTPYVPSLDDQLRSVGLDPSKTTSTSFKLNGRTYTLYTDGTNTVYATDFNFGITGWLSSYSIDHYQRRFFKDLASVQRFENLSSEVFSAAVMISMTAAAAGPGAANSLSKAASNVGDYAQHSISPPENPNAAEALTQQDAQAALKNLPQNQFNLLQQGLGSSFEGVAAAPLSPPPGLTAESIKTYLAAINANTYRLTAEQQQIIVERSAILNNWLHQLGN